MAQKFERNSSFAICPCSHQCVLLKEIIVQFYVYVYINSLKKSELGDRITHSGLEQVSRAGIALLSNIQRNVCEGGDNEN